MQLDNQRSIQAKKPLKVNFDPVYQSSTPYNCIPQALKNTDIKNEKRKRILIHSLGFITCLGIIFHFSSVHNKSGHTLNQESDIIPAKSLSFDNVLKTDAINSIIVNPIIKEVSQHAFLNLKNQDNEIHSPNQLLQHHSLNSKNTPVVEKKVTDVVSLQKAVIEPAIAHASPKIRVLTDYIAEGYNIPHNKAAVIVKEAFTVSKNKGIDPLMLLAITAVESEFNDKARNRSGAVGLVQALPRAHPEKVRIIRQQGGSLYNIHNNLSLGAQIYKEYLTVAKGNPTQALQRYNGSLSDKKKVYSKKVFKKLTSMKKAVSAVHKHKA